MNVELWVMIGASAVVVAIVTVAAVLGAARSARLRELLIEFRASHAEVHGTVKERLDEVSQRVDDGLKQSHQTMGDIRERLAVVDKAQEKMTELSSQVVGLQDILSNKQARGAFGEVQLESLVQDALPPTAYKMRKALSNGRIPDCLVLLPNPPGPIAIDAKFPLEGYRRLHEATDERARREAARDFSRDVTTHINDIAERYIIPGETAESALMFLPSESVYAELQTGFAGVVELSYRKHVYIVSPTTMWATLNTVRAVLRDVSMREQAGVIQTAVHAMIEDVRRLDLRTGNLQRHFDQATGDIREIRTSAGKIADRGEAILEVELDDTEVENLAAPAARSRGGVQR